MPAEYGSVAEGGRPPHPCSEESPMFSALSGNDRTAATAAVLVVIFAVLRVLGLW